jgi:molybdate transport system regulatory protein
MKSKKSALAIQPRFRILRGKDIAMGPGKAELLEQVQKTGSIAEAAVKLDMSYMRAWTLIKTMERCFKQPLVSVSRGGAEHGGAKLTATGIKVVKLYREMEAESLRITSGLQRKIVKLLQA